jgi:RNA polymerase sigma-70 factor, ECF subfamily
MFSGENNDAALLIRIAGGDNFALITLYDRYAPTVLALAQQIMGPGPESDELLQELFLEVWCKAANYQAHKGTVRAWLLLRCRDMALQALEAAPELAECRGTASLIPGDWDPQQHPAEMAAEDPLFGQERAAVQRAIAALPFDEQRILDWFYLENTGTKDATDTLRLREEHLVAHLMAAHQQLREHMQLRRA